MTRSICISRRLGSPGGDNRSRAFGRLAAAVGSLGATSLGWPGTTVTAPPVTCCSFVPEGHDSSVYRTSVPRRHFLMPDRTPMPPLPGSLTDGEVRTSLSNRIGAGTDAVGCVSRRISSESRAPQRAAARTMARSARKKSFTEGSPRSVDVGPNVRAKRATMAGRQARAGENVPRTDRPGLVACRWRSA